MAYKLTKEVFIVGAKRTAFGAYGGSLKDKARFKLELKIYLKKILGSRKKYGKKICRYILANN